MMNGSIGVHATARGPGGLVAFGAMEVSEYGVGSAKFTANQTGLYDRLEFMMGGFPVTCTLSPPLYVRRGGAFEVCVAGAERRQVA